MARRPHVRLIGLLWLLGLLAPLVAVGVAAPPAWAAAPTVTSFTPGGGTIGTSVTIKGTGFTSAAVVRFGGVTASRTVNGSTKIVATVPVDAVSGPVSVTVAGVVATSGTAFTVTPGITGSTASTAPGAAMTLHVVGFAPYEAADLYFDTTDVALATTGPGGAADPSVTVPATATAGSHTWTVVGRHSGTAVQAGVAVHLDWRQWGYDATHRGHPTVGSVLDPQHVRDLEEAWRTTPFDAAAGEAAVAAGVVFQASGNGISAYSIGTGAVRWTHPLPGFVTGGVAVSGSTVITQTDSGGLYALRTTTGAQLWATTVPDTFGSDTGAVAGGLYVVASHSGSVYAVDVTTGAVRWTGTTDGSEILTTPAIADGRVFVGTTDDHEYALDLATGTTLWSDAAAGIVLGSATVANGLVYWGSVDGTLHAVHARTGAAEWSFAAGHQVVGTPSVAGNVVYIGDSAGDAFALDAGTGAQEWDTPVGGYLSGRVTVADGVVYFSSTTATIALWASDGGRLWQVAAGSGGVVVADDGLLVEDGQDRTLVRFVLPPGSRPQARAPDPHTATIGHAAGGVSAAR